MDLLLVSLNVFGSSSETLFKIHTYSGEKKGKVYQLNSCLLFRRNGMEELDTVNKKVRFERLMQIESRMLDSHTYLAYTTWCLPEQLSEAKELLIQHGESRIEIMQAELDAVKTNFEKLIKESV